MTVMAAPIRRAHRTYAGRNMTQEARQVEILAAQATGRL
jgi:hypothetical protein